MKTYKLQLTGVEDCQAAIVELDVGESVAVHGDRTDPSRWIIRDSRDRDLGELPRKGAYLDLIAGGWEITAAVVHALLELTDERPMTDVTVKVTLEDLREARTLRAAGEAMLARLAEEDARDAARAAPALPSPPQSKSIWARLFGG